MLSDNNIRDAIDRLRRKSPSRERRALHAGGPRPGGIWDWNLRGTCSTARRDGVYGRLDPVSEHVRFSDWLSRFIPMTKRGSLHVDGHLAGVSEHLETGIECAMRMGPPRVLTCEPRPR